MDIQLCGWGENRQTRVLGDRLFIKHLLHHRAAWKAVCLRISAVRGALGITSEYSFNKGTTYPPISLLATYTVNGG